MCTALAVSHILCRVGRLSPERMAIHICSFCPIDQQPSSGNTRSYSLERVSGAAALHERFSTKHQRLVVAGRTLERVPSNAILPFTRPIDRFFFTRSCHLPQYFPADLPGTFGQVKDRLRFFIDVQLCLLFRSAAWWAVKIYLCCEGPGILRPVLFNGSQIRADLTRKNLTPERRVD